MTLDEMKKVCSEATPGPWYYPAESGRIVVKDKQGGSPIYPFCDMGDYAQCKKNCVFIDVARKSMAKLIAAAEVMRSEVEGRSCGCVPVCQCPKLPDLIRDYFTDVLSDLEAD